MLIGNDYSALRDVLLKQGMNIVAVSILDEVHYWNLSLPAKHAKDPSLCGKFNAN